MKNQKTKLFFLNKFEKIFPYAAMPYQYQQITVIEVDASGSF